MTTVGPRQRRTRGRRQGHPRHARARGGARRRARGRAGRKAASTSRPRFPWMAPRDPGPARRRPGVGPGGLRALLDAQPDIEVVGEVEDGESAPAGGRAHPGRRADGHPDARHGRPRGHAADPAGGAPGQDPDRDPDDVRRGRLRLRGASHRGQRLPGQRHRAGHAPSGRPDRGSRRPAAVARHHPEADRGRDRAKGRRVPVCVGARSDPRDRDVQRHRLLDGTSGGDGRPELARRVG